MAAEPLFASPWSLPSPYWIVVAGDGATGQPWQKAAAKAGLQPLPDAPGTYAIQTPPQWAGEWQRVIDGLAKIDGHDQLRAAIIAADITPSAKEISFNLRPLPSVQEVVEHLWLLEHLSEDRLVCYLQRVVDRRGKQVGHEAFARIVQEDNTLIGGAAIMRASHVLKVEYQVDRRMHKVAVDTYAACDLEGYLFINFLTGFIHRPEVYLEGLSQAVQRHHVMAKSIALDVPLTDYVRDIAKLKSIAQYCHSRGFSLALDDVMSADGLAALLAEVRPAFVKLDAKLAGRASMVHEIIRIAHAAGALVLAEGIENQPMMDAYLQAGVDMFQGYLLGGPELYHAGKCK